MKLASRTYSGVTNACLILGLASAFVFDRTNHFVWLVIGGFSATVAITTYFVRHWQSKPRTESSRPVRLRASEFKVAHWEPEMLVHSIPRFYVAQKVSGRKASLRGHRAWDLPSPGIHALWSTGETRHDPVEQASRIIKRLQATGKRRTYTIAIAPDGHVTVQFTDVVEQPQSKPAESLANQVTETVH